MSALDTLIRICDKTGVSPSRKNELGEWMEKMERLYQRMERSSSQGTPDAPFFPMLKWGQAFGEILPTEFAMLYQGTGAGTQVISTGSYQAFTAYDAPVIGPAAGASRELGLTSDYTAGKIYVKGLTRQSVVLFYGMTYFPANATGIRGLQMETDDGSLRTMEVNNLGASVSTPVMLVHFRSVPSGNTWYRMNLYQNSGGDLTIASYSSLIAVARIR